MKFTKSNAKKYGRRGGLASAAKRRKPHASTMTAQQWNERAEKLTDLLYNKLIKENGIK